MWMMVPPPLHKMVEGWNYYMVILFYWIFSFLFLVCEPSWLTQIGPLIWEWFSDLFQEVCTVVQNLPMSDKGLDGL